MLLYMFTAVTNRAVPKRKNDYSSGRSRIVRGDPPQTIAAVMMAIL